VFENIEELLKRGWSFYVDIFRATGSDVEHKDILRHRINVDKYILRKKVS